MKYYFHTFNDPAKENYGQCREVCHKQKDDINGNKIMIGSVACARCSCFVETGKDKKGFWIDCKCIEQATNIDKKQENTNE